MSKAQGFTKLFNIIIVAGVILSVLLLAFFSINVDPEEDLGEAAFIQEEGLTVEEPDIIASSAIVWDEKTNEIWYQKSTQVARPLASVTKVLTAIIAAKYIPEDFLLLVTLPDLQTEGESGLLLGDTWSRDQLIGYMLSVSSNDAAALLGRVSLSFSSERDLQSLLNKEAGLIGLTNSRFTNSSGLDEIDGVKSGAEASAADIVQLLSHFRLNYPELALSSTDENHKFYSTNKTYVASNTNELASTIPHLDASKTGFTYVAGGNLAVVVNLGLDRPVYIVVLGSTLDGRFSDVEKLYDFARDTIRLVN